ncbi:hypothetical protein BRC87_00620 [Halobacteriales archaeon QS_4_66_20]|nr:MAG: hypothetical protein BRC87_00620 [Halobacteriales archaeon QS_4_66_20]
MPLAGCGWAQEDGGGGPDQQPGQGSDGSSDGGSSDDDGDTDGDSGTSEEDLTTSEGGTDPIEKDAEELLLTLEDLDSEDWEETNAQITGTCNTFQREGEGFTFDLHVCAEVHDDEAAATEVYEGDLDRSIKLMTEQLDIESEIGDDAAVISQGERAGRFGERTLRLLFRDTNATAKIDFTEHTGLTDKEDLDIPEITPADVVEFGAQMHDQWRD